MTVTHAFTGYGEHAYGALPYGGGTALGSSGFQFTSAIETPDSNGIQFFSTNIGYSICTGYGDHDYGSLAYGSGTKSGSGGVQFDSNVVDEKPGGIQFESLVVDFLNNHGLQFFATNLGYFCPGYGQWDYGTLDYGQTNCEASGGFQFNTVGDDTNSQGFQFQSLIVDFEDSNGIQFEATINQENPYGFQFKAVEADFEDSNGIQFESQIVDFINNQGIQFESTVDAENPQGFQFDAISAEALGFQFTVNLYNTNRLRVMCDFPSRGSSVVGGLNAWGNTIGTGFNWKTNSQLAGDFEIERVNTDIVEEVYRTNSSNTGITLDCDTEIVQGVFLDTLAILNHNFTTSAQLTLIGSNSPTFAPIGVTSSLISRDTNVYHIEEELPLISYRYWRIAIEDGTNTSSILEVGTIVFGAAVIFQGECIIDRIVKRTRHFADSVRTEGFTSVKNDRSIKDAVTLTFEKLEFNKGNFQSLNDIFRTARTSQKCLWIPTPKPTDPSFTERFAVFAKMVEIPEQSHQVMGADEGDYIDLTVELDEAE
jgi:hypothetical protein